MRVITSVRVISVLLMIVIELSGIVVDLGYDWLNAVLIVVFHSVIT